MVTERLNCAWMEYNELVHFVVGLSYYSNAVFFLSMIKVSYVIQHDAMPYLRMYSVINIWAEFGKQNLYITASGLNRNFSVSEDLCFREYSDTSVMNDLWGSRMETRNKNITANGLRKPVLNNPSEPRPRLGQWLRLATMRVGKKTNVN